VVRVLAHPHRPADPVPRRAHTAGAAASAGTATTSPATSPAAATADTASLTRLARPLLLGHVISRADRGGRLGLDSSVGFDRGAVGAFYRSEPGGHARFAGADGMAVASAVGVRWQLLVQPAVWRDQGGGQARTR
jgi:hypothetical protein